MGTADSPVRPLTFVACVSDEASLQSNLLASPCLIAPSPHEIYLARHAPSAAAGLNTGLAHAKNQVVVCLHQDVHLPVNWPERFWQQYDHAHEQYGEIGVVGVYGVVYRAGGVLRAGHVMDRGRLLREPASLPATVDTLDELLLAVNRESRLMFDPRLGFHFYGADICLAAREKGLAAVAIDAFCHHNSRHICVPPEFHTSAQAFAQKWHHRLPVATSCVVIAESGKMTIS
jgi:hypothetical protein